MQPGLGVPVGSRGMGSEPGGSGITMWGWVGARHRTACGEEEGRFRTIYSSPVTCAGGN